VTYVFDGDTVEISTGERVRYIGVDTPEIKHQNRKPSVSAGKRPGKTKN
jgi:endonuclease YncB( thermonuclease family)